MIKLFYPVESVWGYWIDWCDGTMSVADRITKSTEYKQPSKRDWPGVIVDILEIW